MLGLLLSQRIKQLSGLMVDTFSRFGRKMRKISFTLLDLVPNA